MAYQRKDHFYKKAKKEGKVCRAAYKVTELQKRFKLMKKGDVVIDIGCAPGGWLKEISKIVGPKGNVIGVDTEALSIQIPQNTAFILGNVMSPDAINQICLRLLRDADVVVSDLSPKLSGISFRDAYNSYELAMRALEICHGLLVEDGNFLVKIFPGKELTEYKKLLKKAFKKVEEVRPKATRKTSSEIYLVGLGHKKM
ncbi:MAG: RlmE family RNA methyltransferase [Pseudomonadota bacterium]